MDRIIFHIDVNSAYLSWSAIDLLQANPDSVDIRTIPAIIGGNRKTRHGIVLAKSLSAKNTYHIHTAEPVANALKKCPTLTIIPPDHDSYSRHSKQFVGFLRSLTSEIEQVSVDECYLDYTSIASRFSSPEEGAAYIRNYIYSHFGFTVNVGISSNKVLAKMASDFEKPNKTHTLFPDEIQKKNVATSDQQSVHGRTCFRSCPTETGYPYDWRSGSDGSGDSQPSSEKPRKNAVGICKRNR